MTNSGLSRKTYKLCGMCGLEKDNPASPLCDTCISALCNEISNTTGKPATAEEAVKWFENTNSVVNHAEEQQNSAYLTAVYSALFIFVLIAIQYFVWGSSGPVFILLLGLLVSFLAFGLVMYKTENIHLASLAFSVCFGITLAVI